MKAVKTTAVIVVLFFSYISNAQEKYKYMQITFTSATSKIYISGDVEYRAEDVDTRKSERAYNSAPILKKVAEFQKDGWELTNRETIPDATQGIYIMTAYLRKKL